MMTKDRNQALASGEVSKIKENHLNASDRVEEEGGIDWAPAQYRLRNGEEWRRRICCGQIRQWQAFEDVIDQRDVSYDAEKRIRVWNTLIRGGAPSHWRTQSSRSDLRGWS